MQKAICSVKTKKGEAPSPELIKSLGNDLTSAWPVYPDVSPRLITDNQDNVMLDIKGMARVSFRFKDSEDRDSILGQIQKRAKALGLSVTLMKSKG